MIREEREKTGAGAGRTGWRVAAALFLVLGVAFGLLLAWRAWSRVSGARDAATVFDPRPGWLALALLVATADLLLMAAVWAYLFRASGARLGLAEAARGWVWSNVGRYIPGKVWQLGGLAAWARRQGESAAVALFSLLAFQVLVLGTGVAAAAAGLGPGLGGVPAGPATAALLAVLALGVLLHPGVLHRLIRWAARLAGEEIEARRLRVRELAVAALCLCGAWVAYGVGLWCLLRGLTGPPPLGVPQLTGAFAAAYVAGWLVVIVPGGLLVREGALAGLLAALGGLVLPTAGGLAVAARVWTVISELLALGAAALPVTGRRSHGAGKTGRGM